MTAGEERSGRWREIVARLGQLPNGGWLAALFFIAWVPRLLGSMWGMPFTYHPDEHWIFKLVFRMTENGNWDPHWYRYPPLLIYLYRAVVGIYAPGLGIDLARAEGLWLNPEAILPHQFPLLLLGRWLTSTIGAGTAVVVAWGAGRLWGKRAMIVAGLLMASLPLFLMQSTWLTTDVPATFFSAAALALSLSYMHRPSALGALFCGALVAAASLSKYNAAMSLLFPMGALLLTHRGQGRVLVQRLFLTWLGGAATAFLLCPAIYLNSGRFLIDLSYEFHHYRSGHPGYEGNFNLFYYLRLLISSDLLGPAAAILLGGLMLMALWRHGKRRRALPREIWLLLCVSALYLAFLCFFRVRFPRTLLPILPAFVLLATWLIETAAPRRWAGWLLGAAVLLGPAWNAGQDVRALLRPPPGQVMQQWIYQHLPAGSVLFRDFQTPLLDPRRYRVIYGYAVEPKLFCRLVDGGFQYLLVSSDLYQFYREAPPDAPRRLFYQWLWTQPPLFAAPSVPDTNVGEEQRLFQISRLPAAEFCRSKR